jgi:hypothetical protein
VGSSAWVLVGRRADSSRIHRPLLLWAALDLYSGDLLPEDRYAEWAETRREQLRETYLALLTEVADLRGGRSIRRGQPGGRGALVP